MLQVRHSAKADVIIAMARVPTSQKHDCESAVEQIPHEGI